MKPIEKWDKIMEIENIINISIDDLKICLLIGIGLCIIALWITDYITYSRQDRLNGR